MLFFHYLKMRNFKKPFFILVFLVSLMVLYSVLNDWPPMSQPWQKPSNLIDMTNFQFVRNNPTICSSDLDSELSSETDENEKGKLILVMVFSSRENFYRRKAIRKTLGAIKSVKGWELRLVFLIGVAKSSYFSFSDQIYIESNKDIIMGNFEDTYKKLSYKHIMGYKWAIEFCPRADFILKIDDDTFFDAFEVYRLIKKLQVHPNWSNIQFICKKIENSLPIRNEKDNNFVPFDQFPGSVFPDYCSGFAYIVKMEGLQDIYRAQQVQVSPGNHLWVDDIWITGVLRQEAAKMTNKTVNNIWNAKELFHDQDPNHNVIKWYTDFSKIGSQLPWPFVSLNWGQAQNDSNMIKFGDFQTQLIAIWSKTIMVHLYKKEMNITIYA